MGFEWPWQRNDDTGKMHWEENLYEPVVGAALDASIGPLYVVGGVINEATGGTTTAWTPSQALFGSGSAGTEYSNTIMAVSAYDPGESVADGQWGGWQVPVFNRHTPAAIGDGLDLIPDWVKWVVGGIAGLAAVVALRK